MNRPVHAMLLAGDVGGTKTLLGLYEPGRTRPRPVFVRSYPTDHYPGFIQLLDAFAADLGHAPSISAVAIGVAGPVVGEQAHMTNVSWTISARDVSLHLSVAAVALLNDLEAMANSVPALTSDELVCLQAGRPRADGNAVVIAAGTGLGQAHLHRVNGTLRPVASEGGHADFAARTDREVQLLTMLRERFGRAEVEQVISGPGLVNIYRLTHGDHPCTSVQALDADDAPAQIAASGFTGACERCHEATGMFVEAYGSEAGNLALRGLATAGVFVGGGIAPKNLPAFQDGRFLAAFLDKQPMRDLLAAMPVHVITMTEAGLLGAAVHAQSIAPA